MEFFLGMYTLFGFIIACDTGIDGDGVENKLDWLYKLLNIMGVFLTGVCSYVGGIRYFTYGIMFFILAYILKKIGGDKFLSDYYK